jgi:putative glutamine amidotransferase
MQDGPLIALAPNRKSVDYVASLERAGARVWQMDRDAFTSVSVRELLHEVAGVVLPGGSDVDPARYGEPAHPTFDAAEEGRDEFETELIRRAIEQDVPLLAICRGVQILNVALGGSLIQDIPTEHPSTLNHRITDPKWAIAHDVNVAAGSRLREILGERVAVDGTLQVNSRHHQAIKTVAPKLRVTAVASDEIVEAVELPGATFCVGVQWHPENFLEHAEFAPLFEAFVTAGKESRRRQTR